jgi:nitrate reductase delta subunit
VIFKLLSLLLRYPDDAVLKYRGEIAEAVRELPDSPAKAYMVRFLSYWESEPPRRLQERYTTTFDFNRRGSLYLTYYRHGDSRGRGQALADAKAAFAASGYPLDTTELPDYLPLILEFAAAEPAEGLMMLAGHRGAVEVIRRSLRHDGSPYALLVEALGHFLPELDEATVEEMRKLIVQGPPQESVGLEPYAADAPAGGALAGSAVGNVTFHGRKR